MDSIEIVFNVVLALFFVFALIGVIDVVCALVLWRWRVVRRNSLKRAFLKKAKEKRTSILSEKTVEIIYVKPLTPEEMDRYYGAPW